MTDTFALTGLDEAAKEKPINKQDSKPLFPSLNKTMEPSKKATPDVKKLPLKQSPAKIIKPLKMPKAKHVGSRSETALKKSSAYDDKEKQPKKLDLLRQVMKEKEKKDNHIIERNIKSQPWHEKKEDVLKNVIGEYQSKIINQYQTLYGISYENDDKVRNELQSLEKKAFLQQEIEKNEELLNKQKHLFNECVNTIRLRQRHLDSLFGRIFKNVKIAILEQIQRSDDIMNQSKNAKQELEVKLVDYDRVKIELQSEVYKYETLNHMFKQRKEELIFKQKVQLEMSEFDLQTRKQEKYESQFKSRYIKTQSQIDLQVQQYRDSSISFGNLKLNNRFQEQLEDQLSEFEDKNALQEIFKHEQGRKQKIEKKEEDIRQKDLDVKRQKWEEQQKNQNMKKDEIQKEITDHEKLLGKLQEVIFVSDKDKIKDHKDNLYLGKDGLEQLKQKQEIENLQNDIEVEQYHEKKVQKSLSQINNEEEEHKQEIVADGKPPKIITIDMIEQDKIFAHEIMEEKKKQVNRCEKVIHEICLVISRMLYQLQGKGFKNRNVEIPQEKLLNMISICGLRLEKMLAILSKKKDAIRVESINTDAIYEEPPEFIGLNKKDYTQKMDKGLDGDSYGDLSRAGDISIYNEDFNNEQDQEVEFQQLYKVNLLKWIILQRDGPLSKEKEKEMQEELHIIEKEKQ